jgi:tetratricopeptide (TPR) repeat protein
MERELSSHELAQDEDEFWLNRGIQEYKAGDLEGAIASWEKALDIQPDLHEAWYNRGIALNDLGRYEEAVASYDKALELKPNLQQAINLNPDKYRQMAKTDTDFDRIRDDERFQVLLL